MNKSMAYIIALLLITAPITLQASYDLEKAQQELELTPFYMFAQIGGSFSRNLNINVDTAVWDAVVPTGNQRTQCIDLGNFFLEETFSLEDPKDFCAQDHAGCVAPTRGYEGTFRHTPMIGFGFGYYFNSWFSTNFSVNHRSRFRYHRFQIPALTAANTPGFLGTKIRFFDFDNTSFMISARADHTFCPGLRRCYSFVWKPYTSFGIGLSKNSVYSFHSVTNTPVELGSFPSFEVGSIMTSNSVNKFAWQFEFGTDVSFCQLFFVGVGYRYFNGGRFFSNNYVVNAQDAIPTPVVVPPWCGIFRTSELFATFTIDF